MNPRLTLPIIAAVIIVVAVLMLFITWHHTVIRWSWHRTAVRWLPPTPVPVVVNYGVLSCWGHNVNIVIPGDSMVVLRYHVHGNVTINNVIIYIAFPAGIVNETLTAFSRLPNPNDALMIGVYVNGRLIAVNTSPNPIYGLKTTVNQSRGNFEVAYTGDATTFPPINLTKGDVIIVVIYSAVPYALPTCPITNESEETELMVEGHLIGLIGIVNGTPTAEQLYEEGRYITEEPAIYVINVTKPISQLPQELTPSLLTNARPLTTGYAPSFAISQLLPPISGG